jgi:hypothetical protein
VVSLRYSRYRSVVVIGVALGALLCCLPSGAIAGGVHFGFGVDVPLPGRVVGPPVVVYRAPVVFERTQPEPVVLEEVVPPERVVIQRRPPRRVVIEQASPRVVVETAPPAVAYEEPVVVERRSSVTTYYRTAPRVREYREETEREYYGRTSSYRSEDSEF